MNALMNVWYPIAMSREVADDKLLARTLMNLPLVLYRSRAGIAIALQDRCPHRFAPLSRGTLCDDHIACGYHGLRFDAKGVCVLNPHGDGFIPNAAVVRSYPVEERHGFVWVWPGHAAQANAAALPDLSFFGLETDPGVFMDYLHTRSHYELIVDNLLDLSHPDFLHPTTLTSNGAALGVKPSVLELPDGTIRVDLKLSGKPAIAMFNPHLPDPTGPADVSMKMRWWAPSVVEITITASQAHHGERQWPSITGLHLISPETDITSHYFWIGRRNFIADSVEATKAMREFTYHIFSTEDEPMLSAVQERMGTADLWSLKPVLLSNDAGAGRVRRRMQKMIANEKNESLAA